MRSVMIGALTPGDFQVRVYDRVGGRVAEMPTRPPHKWGQFDLDGLHVAEGA